MINVIRHKNWYFALSLLIIIPGLLSLMFWGLNLSIDFVGGSRITYTFPQTVNATLDSQIQQIYTSQKVEIATIQPSDKQVIIRSALMDSQKHTQLTNALHQKLGKFTEDSFETIGPTISSEITKNAFYSVVLASILIVLFIAYSFRKLPKPASSWRFGISAIIALLHDVIVLFGVFSLLGHFFHVEVDALFVTAVLTVIGFSVHDTIVVFDRIRENLRRMPGTPFAQVVNASILQTLNRSLNTSLTVLLVLFGLILFGGESIRWFVVALFVGILSGTYSSIFNASPLLVVWHEWREKRRR